LGKTPYFATPYGLEEERSYSLTNKLEKTKWEFYGQSNEVFYNYDDHSNSSNTEIIDESFDRNGNIATSSENVYEYDSLNRLLKIKNDNYSYEFLYDGLDRQVTKNVFDKKGILLAKVNYLYDDLKKIGFHEDINNIYEVKIETPNEIYPIAYEIRNEIYVPVLDLYKKVSSFVCMNQDLVESNKYKIIEKNQIQALLNEMELDIFYNPNQNLLMSDFFKGVDIYKIRKESFVKDSTLKQNITNCEVRLINPFMNLQKISSIDNTQKNTFKFSKEALEFMSNFEVTPEQIIEAIKKPQKIEKIEDGKFLITYGKIRVLIDMQKNLILSLEKI
jgi:hypothetical protein